MPYLPYVSADRQRVLGHYKVAQRSGEIAATLAAAGHLARLRWAPTATDVYCAVLKIRVGITVSAAVTTAVEMPFRAIIARQFTVDFTTAMTSINLATTANGRSNAMRSSMGGSLMGASGPGICTTVVMSGQTLTADAAPFCMSSLESPSPTLGASAVTCQVGTGVEMRSLYERTSLDDHPPVLSNNEGIIVQNHLAGPGTGTFGLYVEWHWAEVLVF